MDFVQNLDGQCIHIWYESEHELRKQAFGHFVKIFRITDTCSHILGLQILTLC